MNKLKLLTLAATCLFLCTCDPAPENGSDAVPPSGPVTEVTLESFIFRDSVPLQANQDGPAQATYKVSTYRAATTDRRLNRLIDSSVMASLTDQAPGATIDLTGIAQQQATDIFTEYKEQEIDDQLLEEAPHAYANTTDITTEVVHNDGGLLVLATTHYSYQGGAHGNYATFYSNFSTAPPRELTFSDIFRDGQRESLNDMVEEGVVDKSMLFEPDFDLTENVGLLPEGVLFSYSPYEIGPYAAGEIRIVIPYAELKNQLREETKKIVAQAF